MTIQSFNLVGEYNKSRSLELDSEDTVNWYVIKSEGEPDTFAPIPGLLEALQLETGDNPIRDRGIFKISFSDNASANLFYVIAQDTVFRIDSNLVVTRLQGTLNTTQGVISWTNNVSQVGFTDGDKLYYILITGNDVNVVTDVQQMGFPAIPQMIYYQTARFFCTFKGSGQGSNEIFFSDFNDITKWNPLNFFAMNSLGDTTVGISGINQRCFIYGHNIIEVWESVTYPADNPLIRDNNFNYQFGLASQQSLLIGTLDIVRGSAIKSFLYWLTSNKDGVGSFVISYGGEPVKVSNDAVDLLLRSFVNPNNCLTTIYKEAGHIFIENTWPDDNKTLLFDVNTGMWFRKESLDGSRSAINGHIYFNYKHFVTTINNSKLYYLDDDYLTNDGEMIVKTRISDVFRDPRGRLIRANFFEVNFESGVLDAHGDDGLPIIPYAFLSWSNDGGRTFTMPEREEFGRIGQYTYKCQWYMLGMEYSYTFKLQIFEKVRAYVIDSYFDYQVGEK